MSASTAEDEADAILAALPVPLLRLSAHRCASTVAGATNDMENSAAAPLVAPPTLAAKRLASTVAGATDAAPPPDFLRFAQMVADATSAAS